jgi:hypothetical protein
LRVAGDSDALYDHVHTENRFVHSLVIVFGRLDDAGQGRHDELVDVFERDRRIAEIGVHESGQHFEQRFNEDKVVGR